jgi:hypothetical protein
MRGARLQTHAKRRAALEREVEHLRSELYGARRSILRLMPPDLEPIITSYYSCQTRDERYRWEIDVVEQVIESAQIIQPGRISYFGERAACPLCKGESSSAYTAGFSVPEGLRRHLLGWGNVRQCLVMEAAVALARESWHERFETADRAEEKEVALRREERRRSEALYLLGPDETPRLVDEGAYFNCQPRSDAEIAWAERRLTDIGFSLQAESNKKAFIYQRGEVVVYADPRFKNRIDFKAFKLSTLSSTGRAPRTKTRLLGSFYLQDGWKNDLRGKLEARLSGIVSAKSE